MKDNKNMNIAFYNKDGILCKRFHFQLTWSKGRIAVVDTITGKIVSKKKMNNNLNTLPLVERIRRMRPRAAFSLDDNTFLFSLHGCIYRYSILDDQIFKEHEFSKGMNNPLSFCVRYDQKNNVIDALYGEYIGNGEKGPVSIYRRYNDYWKVVYDFPSHTIQHIHNIVYDIYNDRYLIMTGDSNDESGIWESDFDFKNVKPIVKGSQKYRACILMPTKNGFYYVTDTPLEQNYVYFLDNYLNLRMVDKIAGPCIFGREVNGELYFATSVEGDPSLGRWRYRFSNKLGEGVLDRYSHLYRLSQQGELYEIGRVKKDWLPMWLFEFGNMKFPSSDDGKIYICPQSLKGKSGTYVINEE